MYNEVDHKFYIIDYIQYTIDCELPTINQILLLIYYKL